MRVTVLDGCAIHGLMHERRFSARSKFATTLLSQTGHKFSVIKICHQFSTLLGAKLQSAAQEQHTKPYGDVS